MAPWLALGLALSSCSWTSQDHGTDDDALPAEPDDKDPDGKPATQTVGPDGAVVAFDGGSIDLPAGALSEEVLVTVTPLGSAAGLPPLALPGVAEPLELASAVFAFTPHGLQLSSPATVTLRYAEPGHLVVRLDDDEDLTWEAVDGALLQNGDARFETSHFSYYAVVRRLGAAPLVGEPVLTIDDSATRSVGTERAVFDGGRLFWTRDRDGTLAVLTAELSGAVPAQESVLFQVPWVADPGWSNPPLVATTTHLVFPLIGKLELGGEPMTNDGFASLSRDGTAFRPKIWDNWWAVARGPDIVANSFTEFAYQVSPANGSSMPSPFPNGLLEPSCVYDPAADEAGCLNDGWGLFSYRFGDSTYRLIAEWNEIAPKQFGSIRIKANATHWFAPVELVSGWAIAAFARSGEGVTHYEQVPALGAVAVDDHHLYACIDGALTRIDLTPNPTRVVLTEDCSEAFGVSILGVDGSRVYYVHSDEGPHQMYPGKLEIRRVPKAGWPKG